VSRAIIGYTGFVGSNLTRKIQFDGFYNSQNIESISGQEYQFLICAGAPAIKWLANKEPDQDKASLDRLMSSLDRVSVQQFVLISTVDVYPSPIDVDETTVIDDFHLHAYGKHRLELENFVRDRFDAVVIRLPALFGQGLKKNIIYDLLHNNQVEQIHSDHIFQFYNLEHLWEDIQTVLLQKLSLVNFATEPISVQEVAREAFGFKFENRPHDRLVHYDMHTQYNHLFGSKIEDYIYDKIQVLRELKQFVITSRNSQVGEVLK
jgi:hypothetical protein